MNFDIVGETKKGEYYMKFQKPFSHLERIQLLQRSILVQSYAYYELDSNILTDFQYDENAKQLAELKKKHPDEFRRSKYYEYFHDFCSEEDNVHYTSGFDILEKVKKTDARLYHTIQRDAIHALDTKQKGIKDRLREIDKWFEKIKREEERKERKKEEKV